jgi:hypothetical protein
MREALPITVAGHVLITDKSTGEVLVHAKNAIHSRNMATAIARGLSNTVNYQIFKIKLGNQGTYIDNSEQIVFRPPNVTSDSADLYNPTYAEVVDEADSAIGAGNSVSFTNIPGTTNTRVIITAVISANEAINRETDEAGTATPTADPNTDATLDPEGQYFFDELGLFTKQTSGTVLDGGGELLLTHLVYSPIEKTANRELVIVYSLTISCS